MTRILTLRFTLLSAATFGRGEGLPGLVDQEVEHDEYGLPYMRGRTLKGLLMEEMESLLFALDKQGRVASWKDVGCRLRGNRGAFMDETGFMHVGDAMLPENLRRMVAASLEAGRDGRISKSTVLESLTAIRRQTAMTPLGAPETGTLRAMRVVLRGTSFESLLTFDSEPDERDLALLCATTLAWRRAGTGRNRGRGRLEAVIEDDKFTQSYFEIFKQAVMDT